MLSRQAKQLKGTTKNNVTQIYLDNIMTGKKHTVGLLMLILYNSKDIARNEELKITNSLNILAEIVRLVSINDA